MATIICPGCFDIFHQGHRAFLDAAAHLGGRELHTLVICVNTDESAIQLKRDKWGDKYPLNPLAIRLVQVRTYAEDVFQYHVVPFASESHLRMIIASWMPCIIAKGADYVGKKITGEDIAPVILINTPESDEIRQMKRRAYSVS